ncbi:MAG: hypothetical protein ACLUEQ_02180 [Cloacibacillus evryensis]
MKNRKNFCLLSMLLMLAMAVFVSGGCGGGSSGSSEFAGGAGTAENPWRIETAKQRGCPQPSGRTFCADKGPGPVWI